MSSSVILYKKNDRWFYLPLVLSVGLLSSYFGVHRCYGKIKKLETGLSKEEKDLYKQVQKDRKDIYFKAMIQSLVLVLAYIVFQTLFWCTPSPYYLMSNIALLFLGGTFLFYTLLPKNKSMILDANLSNAETKRWYHVYQCMQENFWRMFVAGILVSTFVLLFLDAISTRAEMMVVPLTQLKKQKRKNKKNKRV